MDAKRCCGHHLSNDGSVVQFNDDYNVYNYSNQSASDEARYGHACASIGDGHQLARLMAAQVECNNDIEREIAILRKMVRLVHIISNLIGSKRLQHGGCFRWCE